MPKVKMKESAMGSETGMFTKEYLKGETYEITDSLAEAFVEMGVCEVVREKQVKKESASETKDLGAAPENK